MEIKITPTRIIPDKVSDDWVGFSTAPSQNVSILDWESACSRPLVGGGDSSTSLRNRRKVFRVGPRAKGTAGSGPAHSGTPESASIFQ